MIANFNVPRERFTDAMQNGPPHLKPIWLALRDHGCNFCLVPHGGEPFDPPNKKPTILVIGDDLHDAKGPTGFHRKSLRRYIKRCATAAIISCDPIVNAYVIGSFAAVARRQDVLIVETRLHREEEWRAFVVSAKPEISMLIGTVQPEGGLQ